VRLFDHLGPRAHRARTDQGPTVRGRDPSALPRGARLTLRRLSGALP
jgi:hypothetical protein